jgi:hypothetical protein
MSEVGRDPVFTRNLMVLEHFRYQLEALSDKTTLELLKSFQDKPFMNGEARQVLGTRRQTTWARLATLTQLGLIQKRGHIYRLSPFTRDFVNLAGSIFHGIMTGERRSVSPESTKALEAARQGLELLFSKGKLSQDEYSRHSRALAVMIGGQGT